MEITTVGELLHWSYANLAMAHAAITAKSERYGRMQFMIRSRLYAGLNKQTMSIGALADDERLKMILPQACCYCGSRQFLSADHLILWWSNLKRHNDRFFFKPKWRQK